MNQLRFTTTKPMAMMGIFNPDKDHEPLVTPAVIGELIMDEVKCDTVYIHDDAQALAGYDIPTFIDGNIGQLDQPVEKQDIVMLLPDGEYKCKSVLYNHNGKDRYYITLKN